MNLISDNFRGAPVRAVLRKYLTHAASLAPINNRGADCSLNTLAVGEFSVLSPFFPLSFVSFLFISRELQRECKAQRGVNLADRATF